MTTTAGDPLLELDYPRAFAEAFASTMPVGAKPFRYLHLSGGMVERDQERSLWMKGSMRKIKVSDYCISIDRARVLQIERFKTTWQSADSAKGRGEVQMVDFAQANESWTTIIARPGMVVQRGSIIGEASMIVAGSSGSFIRYDELALALIDAVMHGSEELLLPLALVQRGQKLAQGATK
jgi:hypothetical protein